MTAAPGAQAIFQPALERLERDAARHVGLGTVRLQPVSCEERPFSHLMRLAVHGDDQPAPLCYLFLKLFKAKPIEGGPDAMARRVARDYESTRQAHETLAPYADLGAVPPVACYPDLLAIVTQEVSGPTLLQYLESRGAWFPGGRALDDLRDTATRVGRWIRVFQGNCGGDVQTVGDLRQYIDIRLERLVRHAGRQFTAEDRDRVLRHIDALGTLVAPEDLRQVTAHSDLSLGNILVSGGRIVVLDFAMTRPDTRLYDVAKVALQLELLQVKPHYSNAMVRSLVGAMMHGFDPSLTPEDPLFRLVMLQHRVNHLTSLYVNRAPILEALYNGAVRRQHRNWLERELDAGAAAIGRR